MNTSELNKQLIAKIEHSRQPQELKSACIAYISSLQSKGLPAILTFSHLCRLLNLQSDVVAGMVFDTERYYRTLWIPKRRGGTRELNVPSPTLLYVQRWINHHILAQVPIADCVHGFKRTRSVITNAKAHTAARWMLKIDILDFFPSIRIPRIVQLFKKCGYSRKVSFFLARLCCAHGVLPQGSAASPALANIVLSIADRRLSSLAVACGMIYTRYADDITLSGPFISHHLISVTKQILQECGFQTNVQKTRLIGPLGRKIVTGVSTSSGKLKLPRSSRRMLRKEIFHLRKNEPCLVQMLSEKNDPLYVDRVLGRLNFWKQIEPENTFVLDSIKWLRHYL